MINPIIPIENYKRLAAAIIAQAAEDYTSVWCKCRKDPSNELLQAHKKELEDFFNGGTFAILSENLDGPEFLEKLQDRLRRHPQELKLRKDIL